MRIGVTGSRLLKDRKFVAKAMNMLQEKLVRDAPQGEIPGITSIIHGDARGADRLVEEWALKNGFLLVPQDRQHVSTNAALAYQLYGKHVVPVEANWDQFDLKAGRIRNQLMSDMDIKLLFVFPGNAGTLDMVRRCRRAKIKILFAEDFILGDYEAGAEYVLS